MNDEELDNLMRLADPAQTSEDLRLESEIRQELNRITRPETSSPKIQTGYAWPWLVVPGLIAAVLAVAVFVQVWNPLGAVHSAVATPPLLTLTPTSMDLEDVMDRALSQLSTSNGGEPERRAHYEGWYLQTEVSESGATTSVVTPQKTEFVWTSELSGTLKVVSGRSYVPWEGETVAPADGLAPPPGEIIQQQEFPAGEMPVLFREPPPDSRDEMRTYLEETMGLGPDASVPGYLDAIRVLLSEWTPSAKQMASMLTILRSFGDELQVAGEVTDRLGRPGVAVRVNSDANPHFEYLLIVSRESGRIIALETIYLGGLTELDLPTPCVTDYIAWKNND